MPIPSELRPLYRTKEALEVRDILIARSNNRCENCGKPNRKLIETYTGRTPILRRGGEAVEGGEPEMYWRDAGSGWRDRNGRTLKALPKRLQAVPKRVIRAKLGRAHLDHNPANNDPRNLKFWCDWCHLLHDAPHHKMVRSKRKDAARPLLQEVA